MADIDDILASGSYGASSKDKDVTVEMLDYDFVDSCQDIQLLRGIIRRLKSGRDGHYEALTKHAESRLLEVLPVKERARVVAMRTGPSADEVESAAAGLQDWHDNIQATDAEIKSRQGQGRQQVPPPRFVVCDSNGKSEAPAPAGTRGIAVGSSSGSTPQTSQRISGYDFKAWEKFDPDAAEAELDKEEEQLLSKSRVEREQAQQQLEARQAEMESVLRGMDVSALSAVQRRVSSERERQKGNECFRAQESEQAYVHYTRSIALLGDINFNLKLSADDGDGSEQRRLLAMAYCNRAVAGMKLDRLQQAEDDCGSALGLDPQYLKAWMRRGVARHRRGRYRAAVTDFGEAMKLAEAAGDVKQHAQLKALRNKSLASLREVEGEGADVPEVGGVHTKVSLVWYYSWGYVYMYFEVR
ncbi:hypothetical protein JKP88DRAFT_171099 [Tribonema minus]|uniref:Uncharacterized protein n=1 Tax=Tribonema minus TaxID=303371 RepID=A0A835YMY0_9STRA|nr:hypothetical protein JKP88DRAFT_171099 [Tribonema minus]